MGTYEEVGVKTMGTYEVTNIDWETDNVEIDLPTETIITTDDDIAESLSQKFGWLVNSFEVTNIND